MLKYSMISLLAAAQLHAALADGHSSAHAKPVIYNYIGKGSERAGEAKVKAFYATKFRIVDIGERGFTWPKLTQHIPPLPLVESGRLIKYSVRVIFIITSEGRVIEPFVLSSTNNRLNSIVLAAIPHWHATPASLNGAAISTIFGQELTSSIFFGQHEAVYYELPYYPETAVVHRWQGSGLARLDVRSDGTVLGVTFVRSTGYQRLDLAFREALLRWRFRPEKAPFAAEVPCDFRLGDKGGTRVIVSPGKTPKT